MPIRLSEDQLQMLLDLTNLERGRNYQQQGKVAEASIQKDGHLIVSRVHGSGNKTYNCVISLDAANGELTRISGHCTCPVRTNCKHVAATLCQVLAHQAPAPLDLATQQLDGWLARLRGFEAQSGPSHSKHAIAYLLETPLNQRGRQLRLSIWKVYKRTDGGYGQRNHYDINWNKLGSFITKEDQEVFLTLGHRSGGRHIPLSGRAGAQLLEMLLQTRRCYWQSLDSLPLKLGEPIAGGLEWLPDEQGNQQIRATGLPDADLLPLAPPWYVSPKDLVCGPLDSDLPVELAEILAAAPPIPEPQCESVSHDIMRAQPEHQLALPNQVKTQEVDAIEPVPHLYLYSDFYGIHPDDVEDGAVLKFLYGDAEIHPGDEQPVILHRSEAGLERIRRDFDKEKQALVRLGEAGLVMSPSFSDDGLSLLAENDLPQVWLYLVNDLLPKLESDGWQIEIDPKFRYQLIDPESWYGELDDRGGNDWFGLELGVILGDQAINLLPFLVNYLRNLPADVDLGDLSDDLPLLARLNDTQVLRLPIERLRPLIGTLTELYDPNVLTKQGKLELSTAQAHQVAELAGQPDLTIHGGHDLIEKGKRLKDFQGIAEIPPPKSLQAELRHYQQQGLNWLQFLREHELGGILADDMGLGKTLQALTHLLTEREAGRADRPSLVIAPTSLMVNWRREAERFAPELKVLVLQGSERKAKFSQIPDHDLVLSTYPLLGRDAEYLQAHQYHLLILDEAQHIKNAKTKASQAVRRFKARHRLCLTGTPLENHLGELWSQFHFLMPGLLGDERRFRRIFRNPIEKKADQDRAAQLKRRIAPFILRREKAEVVKELPPKSEIVSPVELIGRQRDLYETIRLAMHTKVQAEIKKKGMARSQIVILEALLKLRQVCCDPRLVKLDAARKVQESAKLELLREMLPELVYDGRRILLFSQFTSMLSLIEQEAKQAKIDYVKLTGQTRDRETPVDRFQNGEVPLFLISLKAGGTGLNLTAADTVIHYDPWWNPAVERQATDRAHRIGQDKPVFVYKLISQGTVEEKIAELQAKKQELADALFSEGGKAAGLTAEDLQGLFEPLA